MKNAWLPVVLLLSFLLAGCSAEAPGEAPADNSAAPSAAAPSPADPARVQAVLAACDRADGAEDKVVAKCAGCALHMDGSEDHTLTVEGYRLRFCSATCKEAFSEDAAGKLVAMELPDES